jgi:hypothetical protein
VVTVDQLVKLEDALGQYVSALEHLASIRPCQEVWPADPPGPGYVGTRCQLLEGHAQQKGTRHRHRMLGSQVTVEWD